MKASLEVRKTYKFYVGGGFVRSESGRCLQATSQRGELLDNYCRASRKDFRDAVLAARTAFEGWATRSAYLRGQILYRAAEMLQGRMEQMGEELARSTGLSSRKCAAEVQATIDRLVYFAGWCDKHAQILGTANPVASSHFNFTTPEPSGVVVVMAPDEPALLPLVALAAPVVLSGNTAVIVASERFPLPAFTFGEILATSDFPGGVLNILAGKRDELAPHLAAHMDVNAIVDGSGVPEIGKVLQAGTGLNLKRYVRRDLKQSDWAERGEDPYWIWDTVELKTAWHPVGL